MKFKLPRIVITPELRDFLTKELKRRGEVIVKADKVTLEEMAEASKAVLSTGIPKNLVRKKLPKGLGYGIFLRPDAEPILKRQVIASYSGDFRLVPQMRAEESDYAFAPMADITLSKKDHKRLDPHRAWHPRRLYELLIDADKKGNFTRFINHSSKPNILAEELRVPNNPYGLTPAPAEIVYIAKKTIRPGEQLLVSYEDGEETYWAVMGIKPLPITPQTFRLDAALRVIGDCPSE